MSTIARFTLLIIEWQGSAQRFPVRFALAVH